MTLNRIGPSVKFEDTYFKSSKFLMYFALFLGVSPIYKNSRGFYWFRWFSLKTLYSVFAFGLVSCSVIYSTYVKVLDFQDPKLPFDDYLITLIFLAILAPHWFFQIVSVSSCKGLAEYLTMWTQFQKHFHLVTGTIINFNHKNKIRVLIFGASASVMSPIVQTWMQDSLTMVEAVGYFHVLALNALSCVAWSIQCASFVCAVKQLRENMKKELIDYPMRVQIRSYRYLWEDIHALIEKMSSSLGYLYGMLNFFTYIILFISIYCTLVKLFSLSPGKYGSPRFIGFLECSIYFAIHVYGFYNSTHFLEEEITHAVTNDLMEIQLYKLSSSNVREVQSFVDTIRIKKVGLVVGGNITIGRQTLTDYVSSVAMYCLILAQFKVTLPAEH